jgi:hypothetical protein
MDTTDARKPGDRLRNISMGQAEAADERMWDIGCYWVLFCLDLCFAKGDSWQLRRPRGTAVMSPLSLLWAIRSRSGTPVCQPRRELVGSCEEDDRHGSRSVGGRHQPHDQKVGIPVEGW